MSNLPIQPLRPTFEAALEEGPVVVSSPTGSGKSTQVPRWCPGPVLVVEPRRVACRSLAQRVAELEDTSLGREVGYWVRDDKRAGDATRITFATPGIALRIFAEIERYRTVILDEFHERSLDVDLLLALLLERYEGHRVAMSATLEGERVAVHLGGRHLHAEGRTFPVDIEHLSGRTLLPDVRGLEERVRQALGVIEARDLDGDVLVFLPGKGEIASVEKTLGRLSGIEILPLHGGLSLEEQSRVFEPVSGGRRKVVLATNVAETSLTIPGIGVVVDSGLVRRTRYREGRGFLTLAPVALDSADQRAGRAGRTAPGWCFRLWSEEARLEAMTPPEIHRESLIPLVLGASALGAKVDHLPFLDPPKEHAVETARADLQALGALDGDDRITPRGTRLFGLPLDASLGALLVAAEQTGDREILRDMVDLVSALAPGRRLYARGGGRREGDPEPTLDEACDAVNVLRELRGGKGPVRRLDPGTRAEAKRVRSRLEEVFDLGERPGPEAPIDRKRLAFTVLSADSRRAHVARRRGRRVAWSPGGTEIDLGRESAVTELGEEVQALVVLDTMALGTGGIGARDTKILATAAMPVPLSWLAEAGLGRERVGRVDVEKNRRGRPVRLVATVERIYARRIVEEREEVPRGELARDALAQLFLQGRLFREALQTTKDRLEAAALARNLAAHVGSASWLDWRAEVGKVWPDGVPALEGWVEKRVAALGVESGADVALLEPEDLEPPDLPSVLREELEKTFPRTLELPDATYAVEYEPVAKRVILEKVQGSRKVPPPVRFLPRFEGFRILIRHKDTLLTLRDERGRVVGTSVT